MLLFYNCFNIDPARSVPEGAWIIVFAAHGYLEGRADSHTVVQLQYKYTATKRNVDHLYRLFPERWYAIYRIYEYP